MRVAANGVADYAAEEGGLGFFEAEEGDAVGCLEVRDTATARDVFERPG